MTVSGWLVVLAVVVGVNPVRVGWARLDGRDLARPAGTVASGTALGGTVAVVLAVVGDAALAAIDVSAPTAWVGAGLVLVLAGTWAAVGPRPRWEPALPGARAALVPVAVPLVARPEVGLVALAAGADGHLPAVLVGVGTTVLAALGVEAATRGRTGAVGRRLAGWGARTTGAIAVATGIAVTVAGVFAI